MVKNVKGGSGHKSQARKFASTTGPKTQSKLRISQEEDEKYAIISKVFGNGMCDVLCIDNYTRLCIIRGKFRGRGKRDNTIRPGSWVLVGARSWASEKEGEKQKCDLLEVYSDLDVERLKKSVHENWTIFTTIDSNAKQIADDKSGFEFNDTSNSEEYERVMQSLEKGVTTSIGFSATSKEEEVDIDDI